MVQFDVKRVQKGTESFMVSFDFTKTPVTQIADYIIIAASKYGTSDIHFDPRAEGMMVRFRIDGDCQDYTFVPKAYEKNLTTRLKIMANMNITESRLPQDGAIKGEFGGQYLDMRVSSLPLNEGEKIVIRILDLSRSNDGVDTLGFHPNNLEKIKRMMNLPNGIILTTGATGSGKSTTTYAILNGLNKPETNVITVEDPIEMNIEGINQVQVNADIGMTFAAALRSILRQDPNIILIGEIRDSETAQIAVRAAITGHLVLSTIHTNNALATVERLLDMNVERYLLSTALSGIISQRLAKMLCPDCRYQRDTTKYEKKIFKKYMNMDVPQIWDANPKGCEHCRKGYHGRLAFHEVLELDESIRASLSNEKLDKKDLAKMVYSGKTITMLQDALIKCLDGKTSFEEVYRNIEIENEDDDNYENEMATEIKDSAPPEEEPEESSDDLLDTPKAQAEEGTIVLPPSFTAADFSDEPSEGQTTEEQPIEESVPSAAEATAATPVPVVSGAVPSIETVPPVETTPVEAAPVEAAPVETTPAEVAPVDTIVPAENSLVESVTPASPESAVPVETVAPIEVAPVADISVAAVPVADASSAIAQVAPVPMIPSLGTDMGTTMDPNTMAAPYVEPVDPVQTQPISYGDSTAMVGAYYGAPAATDIMQVAPVAPVADPNLGMSTPPMDNTVTPSYVDPYAQQMMAPMDNGLTPVAPVADTAAAIAPVAPVPMIPQL